MLLIPFKIPYGGALRLDAFSNNLDEINSVNIVLEESQSRFTTSQIFRDAENRIRQRFTIDLLSIKNLEKFLGIKFSGSGSSTSVKVLTGKGCSNYKCIRLDNPPRDCTTFYAIDMNQAIVKCALIANENNWLGGVPKIGFCGD